MERLTYKDNSVPHTNAKGELWEAYSDRNYNEVINRLAAYEDSGLEPDEVDLMRDGLSKYHELEAKGLLVRLPCKVGDKVYALERFCDGNIGDCYSWLKCEECEDFQQEVRERRISTLSQAISIIEMLGETVFLSREEAEAALKED